MSRPQVPEILVGVQGKDSGFCHFDGNWLEIVQKTGAAEGPSADAEAANHSGLVPDADLAQFDAGAEYRSQIFTSSRKSTRSSAVK